MKTMYLIATILVLVGGLNWLLVGLFNFNLVSALFGDMTLLSRIVYVLVGVSALAGIVELATGGMKKPMV